MNILRLSTLSLTLAVAVFALGYNPSFADSKNGACAPNHCDQHGDDGGGGGGDDPSGGGKAFLFDSPQNCDDGATNTGGPSFGHVSWSGNILPEEQFLHVHYKLQLKDVDPGTYEIRGNQQQACPSTVDFLLCTLTDCLGNFITVKNNGQGRTSGQMNFPVHLPGITTRVWVTVSDDFDDPKVLLRSPAVTMVLPDHEVNH